jgi:hypothetical protein
VREGGEQVSNVEQVLDKRGTCFDSSATPAVTS